MKALVVLALKNYKKYVSPFLPHSCRFHPSCSSYCLEAVDRYGLFRGLWLFLKRIVKCQPFYPGGYDPVGSFEKEDASTVNIIQRIR